MRYLDTTDSAGLVVMAVLALIALLAAVGALTLRERLGPPRRVRERALRQASEQDEGGPGHAAVARLARLAATDPRLQVDFDPEDSALTIARDGRTVYIEVDRCTDTVVAYFAGSDDDLMIDDADDPQTVLDQVLHRLAA